MEIGEILQIENIDLELEAKTKEEVLKKMSEMLLRSGKVKAADSFMKDVLSREKLGFTGAGNRIAIPHGISEQADKIAVAMARTTENIIWETWQEEIPPESKNVRFVILFAVPVHPAKDSDIKYIDALKRICGRLVDKQMAKKLMTEQNAANVIQLFETER